MLLVSKENLDLLVGTMQVMVSLVSMRIWKCPILPLKGRQRLKIQDSYWEPSQRVLILLPKKGSTERKLLHTNLLVGICLHKTQLFSCNCRNAREV